MLELAPVYFAKHKIEVEVVSETAFMLRFSEKVSVELPSIIRQVQDRLQSENYVLETLPSYTSLMVIYNVNQVNNLQAYQAIRSVISAMKQAETFQETRLHEIPVCYDFSFAFDLQTLAEKNQLTAQEVIRIHSQTIYQVYATGFSPGFAYLGLVDDKINHPRHTTPRQNVPAGSVGIADNQTGIYPSESPAGWQIIGQTPLDLSLNHPKNLTRFQVGDQVKFRAIPLSEFQRIKQSKC